MKVLHPKVLPHFEKLLTKEGNDVVWHVQIDDGNRPLWKNPARRQGLPYCSLLQSIVCAEPR